MEAPKINQKEYLKRYLSKSDGKKKKKKKINVGPKKVQIIDDDIDFKKLTSVEDDEIDIFNATEDAPQIVGIIDERGPVDFDNKQRWKVIADDGTGDIAISRVEDRQRKQTSEADNDGAKESSSKALKQSGVMREETSKKKRRKNVRESSSSSSNSDRHRIDRKKLKKHKGHSAKKQKKKKKQHESSSSDSSSDSSSETDSSDDTSQRRKKSRKRLNGREGDNDLSRSSNRKREVSPSRRNKDQNSSDSDMSLPRPSKKTKIVDQRVERSKTSSRNQSDSDLSPPRNSNSKSTRKKDLSDSDLSPPRVSYSRSKRKEPMDSDCSPPRKPKSKTHRTKNSSDSDLSPPRNSRREEYRKKSRSNGSPSRKYSSRDEKYVDRSNRKNHHKSSDRYSTNASRDSSKYDSDLSPPRSSKQEKTRSSGWDTGSRRSNSPEKRGTSEKGKIKKKAMDGTSAGLKNLRSLMEEEEALKKRNAEMMKKVSMENSGFGQAAVVRDRKTGRKRDLEKEAAEKLEKQKEQDEINAKYAVWGRGLKQTEERGDKMKRDLHEMNKPLARYADDQDLESELKSRERMEDPMLAYIKEKEIQEGKRAPDAPKYEGSYMPNRFGIRPGHRWDGVDRSNGFEKKWFEARNSKKAVEEEAYKWSTADM